MTLVCDTQKSQELIQRLREPWAQAMPIADVIDQLEQHLLHMANDRADAREMLDQSRRNHHALSVAYSNTLDLVVDLRRKQANIEIWAADDLAIPAHKRIEAIRAILTGGEG